MPDWVAAPFILALAGLLYLFAVRPALKEPPLPEIEGDDEAEATVPPATDDCHIHGCEGRRVRHACGHVDHVRYKISMWGQLVYEQRGRRAGKRCANCALAHLKRISIRCCRCGHAIFPGQMVATYASMPDRSNPAHTTYVEDKLALGCLRVACADGGFMVSGHWMGEEGYRPLIPRLGLMDTDL